MSLAQLAADQFYDPEQDVDGWYSYYLRTVAAIGWTVRWTGFKECQPERGLLSTGKTLRTSRNLTLRSDEREVLGEALSRPLK